MLERRPVRPLDRERLAVSEPHPPGRRAPGAVGLAGLVVGTEVADAERLPFGVVARVGTRPDREQGDHAIPDIPGSAWGRPDPGADRGRSTHEHGLVEV